MKGAIVGLFLCLIASQVQAKTWLFDVSMDGKSIGRHEFSLTTMPNDLSKKTLRSEAKFNVKFLFINAFNYYHLAEETWQQDCLESLEAKTQENKEFTQVSGRQDNAFKLQVNKSAPSQLGACVMTFAYWNPKILEQQKLLNPQTGEYLDANIDKLGKEVIQVSGAAVSANHYRIKTSKFKIDVWYREDGEWLALKSTTAEGRSIYYKLQQSY